MLTDVILVISPKFDVVAWTLDISWDVWVVFSVFLRLFSKNRDVWVNSLLIFLNVVADSKNNVYFADVTLKTQYQTLL